MWGKTRRDAFGPRVVVCGGGGVSDGSSWSGTSKRVRFPRAAATPGGERRKSGMCVLGLRLPARRRGLNDPRNKGGSVPSPSCGHLALNVRSSHRAGPTACWLLILAVSDAPVYSLASASSALLKAGGSTPPMGKARLPRQTFISGRTPFPALLVREQATPCLSQPLLLPW